MINFQRFRQCVVAFTGACFLALGLQAPAAAAVIGTPEFLAQTDRAADLQAVEGFLSRADVRDQLVTLGVDPDRAAERVAALSDQELATMAGQLSDLPAGGDSALAVIGIVFVVLLILELTGVIDIFKRT